MHSLLAFLMFLAPQWKPAGQLWKGFGWICGIPCIQPLKMVSSLSSEPWVLHHFSSAATDTRTVQCGWWRSAALCVLALPPSETSVVETPSTALGCQYKKKAPFSKCLWAARAPASWTLTGIGFIKRKLWQNIISFCSKGQFNTSAKSWTHLSPLRCSTTKHIFEIHFAEACVALKTPPGSICVASLPSLTFRSSFSFQRWINFLEFALLLPQLPKPKVSETQHTKNAYF